LNFDSAKWIFVSAYVLATIGVAVGVSLDEDDRPAKTKRLGEKILFWSLVADTLFTILIFAADGGISKVQNDEIIALRTQTAARPWSEAQFDAIQEVKGKITDVGIYPEKGCLECQLFSEHIELALHAAGVQIHEDDNLDWMTGTGVMVWLPEPAEENDPLVKALKDAGLNPGSAGFSQPNLSPVRTDIRVIFVGEKFPTLPGFPYSPSGQTQWTLLPLRNPNFVPPATKRPTIGTHIQIGPQ